MRYIDINKIQPGVYLAKPLFTSGGAILLHEQVVLTEALLNRLKALDFKGLYIEDELSKDILMEEVVEERVRLAASTTIKNIMTRGENVNEVLPLMKDIIGQIVANKDMLIQIDRLQNYHDYTYTHCVNVGILSVRIGVEYKLKEDKLINLGLAGILHDIGKQKISLDIIDKEGKLTDEEFEIIKKHPRFGYELVCNSIEIASTSRVGILDHHERYNGYGYPRQLKGEEISFFGRIIAVADTYDAMASDRCYRKALPLAEIIEYLMANAGELFDFDVVKKFVNCTSVYPTGACVELSDGKLAIVVKNHNDCILRPLIRLIDTMEEIDLMYDHNYLNLRIERVIEP